MDKSHIVDYNVHYRKWICCAIVLGLLVVHTYGTTAATRAEPDKNSVLPARAPLRLTLVPELGYTVTGTSSFRSFFHGSRLVSIDRKNLTNLNQSEIESLLDGPLDSEVEISVLTYDGQLETERVKRTRPLRSSMWDRRKLLFSNYDARSARNWNSSFVEDSLDLEALATQGLVIREAAESLPPSKQSISIVAFASAITNYQLGNLQQGDLDLQKSFQNYQQNQRWLTSQNIQPIQAINLLIGLNRDDFCSKVLEMMRDSRSFQLKDCYGQVALTLVSSHPSAAFELTQNCAAQWQGNETPLWVPYIYRKTGDLAKAKALIAKHLEVIDSYANMERRPLDALSGAVAIDPLREYCRWVYELACTESELGEFTEAALTLKNGISLYESKLSKSQLEALDKQPVYFPKPGDLRAAKENVESSKKLISPTPLKLEQQLECAAVASTASAIEKADKDTASKNIKLLLQHYRYNIPDPLSSTGKLNVYCAILSLARQMTNRGWYSMAETTMTQLREVAGGKDANPMAQHFLAAEIFYDASKMHESKSLKTAALSDAWNNFAKQSNSQEPLSEQFRQLAVLYYYAAMPERAEFFIKNAQDVLQQESGRSRENIIKLDAACIAASQKNYKKAQQLFHEAITIPGPIDDAFYFTAIELSSIYKNSNLRDEAIKTLQLVREKPNGQTGHRWNDSSVPMEITFAKLLLESDRAKEAYAIASATASKKVKLLNWNECYIVGKCAEAAGDYEKAAEYLEKRRWLGGGSMSTPELTSTSEILQEAFENIEKTKENPQLHAKICTELADSLDQKQSKRKYELYQKALSMTPDDNSQEKVQLLQKLANLSAYSMGPGREPGKADGLKFKNEAAQLAERNHASNAARLWALLANEELNNTMVERAIEHMRRAISLYDGNLSSGGAMAFTSEYFPEGLKRLNRGADAERILGEALEKTISVTGPESSQTQVQLLDSFKYEVNNSNEQSAQQILDKLLLCNMRTGETVHQSMMHSHCGMGPFRRSNAAECVAELISIARSKEKTHPKFAETILTKVLAAQQQALKPNDDRMMITLAAMSGFRYRQGDFKQAESYGRQAYDISKQYFSGEFAVRQAGPEFLLALEKLGKTSEAQSLAKLRYVGVDRP